MEFNHDLGLITSLCIIDTRIPTTTQPTIQSRDMVEPIQFTPEEIQEARLSQASPIYFIENVCNITLTPDQKQWIQIFNTGNKINDIWSKRQEGNTLISVAYMLYCVVFQNQKTYFHVSAAHTHSFDVFKKLYYELPEQYKPPITTMTKHHFEFQNGCNLSFRSYSTIIPYSRGTNIAVCILDNFDCCNNQQEVLANLIQNADSITTLSN